MALKPFFSDAEDAYFDRAGMPTIPGQYEFLRSDGRRVIYTLDFEKPEVEAANTPSPEAHAAGETEVPSRTAPRLRVVRASRFEDFPQPAHALRKLDGEWLRFLSALTPEIPSGPMEPNGLGAE